MKRYQAVAQVVLRRGLAGTLAVAICLLVVGCPPEKRTEPVAVTQPGTTASEESFERMVAEDYWDEEGQSIKLVQPFKQFADGRRLMDGTEIAYWEDGAKRSEIHYVDGLKHGTQRTWYRSGAPWSQGEWKNGKEQGRWVTWYPTGVVEQEFFVVDGVWQGMFTTYHPNGEKMREVEFVDGRMVGTVTTWDEEGNIVDQREVGTEGP